MSRSTCNLLDNGDIFPYVKFNSVGDNAIILPDAFDERWNVLILYRGHW